MRLLRPTAVSYLLSDPQPQATSIIEVQRLQLHQNGNIQLQTADQTQISTSQPKTIYNFNKFDNAPVVSMMLLRPTAVSSLLSAARPFQQLAATSAVASTPNHKPNQTFNSTYATMTFLFAPHNNIHDDSHHVPVVSMMLLRPTAVSSLLSADAGSFSCCFCSSGNTVAFTGAMRGVNLNTARDSSPCGHSSRYQGTA